MPVHDLSSVFSMRLTFTLLWALTSLFLVCELPVSLSLVVGFGLAVCMECSTSPSGGNQVDGLPPAPVKAGISRRAEVFFYLKRRMKAGTSAWVLVFWNEV